MVIRIRSTEDRDTGKGPPLAEPADDDARSRKPYAVVAVLAAVVAFLRGLMGEETVAAAPARAETPDAQDPGQAADMTMPMVALASPARTPADGAATRVSTVAVNWAGAETQIGPVRMVAPTGLRPQGANDNGFVLPDAEAFLAAAPLIGQPPRPDTLAFAEPSLPPAPPPPPVVIAEDTDCGCGSGDDAAGRETGTAPPPDRRTPPALEPVVIGTILCGGAANGAEDDETVLSEPDPPQGPQDSSPPPQAAPEDPAPAPPVSEPQTPAPPSDPADDPSCSSDTVGGAADDGTETESPAVMPPPAIIRPECPELSPGSGTPAVIAGSGGDDTIFGGAGADLILGGDGDDLIFGGNGNDTLFGGNGADTLLGEAGDDLIFGGAGDDLLLGGDGDDLLLDGTGADTLLGGTGDDHILVLFDADPDQFDGGEGADLLDYSGTATNLTISVAAGGGVVSSPILSPEGSDSFTGFETISAGSGDDHFLIGAGAATLRGGEGEDIFEFCLPPAPQPDSPALTPNAPLRLEYLLDDFEVGDRMRLRHYDIVDDALDGLEDQFERIYGTEIEDDDLRLSISYEAGEDGPRTVIRGTMDRDDSFTLTITLEGHRALAVVEFA